MYVHRFSGMFSAFDFTLVDGDISIKNKIFQNFYDVKPSVFSHSKNTLVNFIRHLTCINIACLA
jgi:hypothetical protein